MQSLSLENSGFDLRRLTAKQALSLAKSLSGKSVEEIAEALGQDHSSVKRYFKESDNDYYPSLLRIPCLCQALGNTLILDWVEAQFEDRSVKLSISSDTELLRRLNRLAGELGSVHQVVDETLSGPGLDKFDPRRVMSELFEVEQQVRELRHSLQRASGKRIESNGWSSTVVRGA